MGERVAFPRRDRAWDILTAMAFQIGRGLGRRHFRIGDVKRGTVLEPTYIVMKIPLAVRRRWPNSNP